MKIFDFLKRGQRHETSNSRSYNASNSSRLTLDWIIAPLSADAAMRGKLSGIRDRARDLERNNEWARGFFRTLENNVVGEGGIALQMRIKNTPKETLDEVANDLIETAWWRWGKVGSCTVCGRHSWWDLLRIIRPFAKSYFRKWSGGEQTEERVAGWR